VKSTTTTKKTLEKSLNGHFEKLLFFQNKNFISSLVSKVCYSHILRETKENMLII